MCQAYFTCSYHPGIISATDCHDMQHVFMNTFQLVLCEHVLPRSWAHGCMDVAINVCKINMFHL